MSSTDRIVMAELERRGVCAELHLNHMPVLRLTDNEGPFGASGAHEFLIPGSNLLELIVEPGPSPSRWKEPFLKEPPADAFARARLMVYPPDVEPGLENGVLLGELNWRPEEKGLLNFPKAFEKVVMPGAVLTPWAWQDAAVLSMGDALVAEAHALLEELVGAFRMGDANAVAKLTEIKIRDALRAYPAQTETAFREMLDDYVRHHKKGAIRPLNPADYEFRLIAGGRILECLNRDFSPSMELSDPELEMKVPYPVWLSKIGGKLVVVR